MVRKYTTSERLHQIMEEENIRQVDILHKAKPYCEKYDVKLNKSDLSQFVNGKVEPGQWKLTILALALDVSETWLMGLDTPKQRGLETCPVCGLTYASDYEPDVISHQKEHQKVLDAIKQFGFYYDYPQREEIKAQAYKIINGEKYSLDKKIRIAIEQFKAYFSRSVSECDYDLNHPEFDKYVAMCLNQKAWRVRLGNDVYDELVKIYGKAPGMSQGTYCKSYIRSSWRNDETVSASHGKGKEKKRDTNSNTGIYKNFSTEPLPFSPAEVELIQLYRKLDSGDQGEIRGEIKQMLKSEKYIASEKEKTVSVG